jgi:hypothetical protein
MEGNSGLRLFVHRRSGPDATLTGKPGWGGLEVLQGRSEQGAEGKEVSEGNLSVSLRVVHRRGRAERGVGGEAIGFPPLFTVSEVSEATL